MGDFNILNGGVEQLNEIRGCLLHLDQTKKTSAELASRQAQLEKDIAAKQKAMDKEIDSTVSKRNAELEDSFDSQIDKTKSRIKETKNKRDKAKGEKVSERIGVETADQKEEIRSIKQEIKGVFTKDKISRLFNTKYFFALFLPSSISDYLLILLTVLLLVGIPLGAYTFFVPETSKNIWLLIGIYAVVAVVFFGLFFLIFKKVRGKHLVALRRATELRERIANVKKSVKKTTSNIRKDDDETSYGLESFDSELSELDTVLSGIVEQKKQALAQFENSTKQDIINEIRIKYVDDIEALKRENEEAHRLKKEADDDISATTMGISQNYEAYLGKENLCVSVIDTLIGFINNGNANNISEALDFYKKQIETK